MNKLCNACHNKECLKPIEQDTKRIRCSEFIGICPIHNDPMPKGKLVCCGLWHN